MSLQICTRSPHDNIYHLEWWKLLARKIIKRQRGPQAVVSSLCRGLDDLGIEYFLNSSEKNISNDDTVWSTDSLSGFKWALKLRQSGKIAKLVVGPSIGQSATESIKYLTESAVDLVLQPSDWVLDFCVKLNPGLRSKIRIWPAGVSVPNNDHNIKKGGILLYVKNPSDITLVSLIKGQLKKRNIVFTILNYGKFKQSDYYKTLEMVSGMIYLSDSESQGIALQEAWARNVPTLVWSRGFFDNGQVKIFNNKISAPFFNDEAGIFFTSQENFEKKFDFFWSNLGQFKAREYVVKNLSDVVCARKFLEIIT